MVHKALRGPECRRTRPWGAKGRGFAAGCAEGLYKKVLKIDRPFRAGGFLGLTAAFGRWGLWIAALGGNKIM